MLLSRSANPDAADDEKPRDALTALPLALPAPLALRIWAALPCDTRLRCREVARAWRDALAEPRAWVELDVTAAASGAVPVTPALLRAAAARAGGRLERLCVMCAHALEAELLAVVAANAGTLRLLRLERRVLGVLATNRFQLLLRAAPQTCVVEADVSVAIADAGRLLRCKPPFQMLRLLSLEVQGDGVMLAADVAALAAQLAAHSSLRELSLWSIPLDTFAALDAVVDAALTLRLRTLVLEACHVRPASAVALPRLLRCDALRELEVEGGAMLLDAPAAALLAAALRSNRTLTSLALCNVGMWLEADVAALLFGALVGHASMLKLRLCGFVGSRYAATAAGAALGALVAANAPLRVLNVSWNGLADAGLGPLVDALPRNTHLRELSCRTNYGFSAAFAREVLIPALAANTSLQKLHSGDAEADAFIAARTAAVMTA